ncbi:pyocin knob domain-containing protein [Devosia sp.]|uniref:pyocin knob domain-containing protein n=1 Tax=Devosia sp. TaxID=1871048 RepID=UPI003F703F0D
MSDTITPRLRIKAQPEVAVRAKAVPPPKVRLRVLPTLLPLEIELRNTGAMVQWRYLGQAWQDLIAIDAINASVAVGTVTTLPPGSPATVVNVGTAEDMVLNFGIPSGLQGIQGEAATVAVGSVTTVGPGVPAEVTNIGTPNDAVFDFDIPQGAAATVAVGTVSTLAPGAPASVVNVGAPGAAVLNFGLPRGAPGLLASVVAGANVTVDSTDPANPIVAAAGNVGGPASAVDNRVATFNGTTGKLLKDSGVILGNVASRNIGTTAGTAAAGDDTRFETVPNDYVSNAKLANMANATVKGRNTAGTGDPEDVTMSQLKALLALAATDIVSGTFADARLPTRLGVATKNITDWNAVLENGYHSAENASNAPTNTGPGDWYICHVIALGSTYLQQYAYNLFNGAAYRRLLINSVWGAWIRLRPEGYLAARAVAGTTDTLVYADMGGVVEFQNGSATTCTVPPNSSAPFPVDTIINLMQYGVGQVTVAAGVGVTVRSAGSRLKLNGQYSAASLRKRATDEWWLFGDVTT